MAIISHTFLVRGAKMAAALFSISALTLSAQEGADMAQFPCRPCGGNTGNPAAKTMEAKEKILSTKGSVIKVSDFGAIPGDGKCDLSAIQAALDALAKEKNAVLTFEKGVYDLRPSEGSRGGGRALVLENAKCVVIDGNGALFLQHDNSKGFLTINNCEYVHAKNMELDFAEQPYAAGSVESVNTLEYSFIVALSSGYPAFSSPALRGGDGGFFLERDIPGAILSGTDAVRTTKITPLGGNLYKIFTSPNRGGDSLSKISKGDIFILNCKRSAAAFGGSSNSGCILENINIYASGAGAFTFSRCSGLKFLSCAARIKPGRPKSVNADGFHLPHCRNVTIENCLISGASDDCLNMYLTPCFIKSVNGNANIELCKAADGKPYKLFKGEISAGDTLAFFSAESGEVFARAKVVSFNSASSTARLDRDINGLRPGLNKKTDITVYNLSDSRGLKIKNSKFCNSSRFGLYIKASDVSVEGCRFENLGSSAITMHNEPGWPEGLYSENVEINGCKFSSNGRLGMYQKHWPGGDISSLATGVRFGAARKILMDKGVPLYDGEKAYFNSNLKIYGCEFSDWLGCAVYMRSVKEAEISNCTFYPPRLSSEGVKDSDFVIRADFCSEISLYDNTNNSGKIEFMEK